ncbi:MAG: hypothetical protein V4615_05125 [Bacteroidota bacterium]
MNYIKLINQFWKLRRSKRITSKQADLYFFLIQECNEQDWQNPFECSNKLIIASIDITEPSLIDARNRLKQLGLLDFKAGRRNEASPIYTLCYLNDLSRNRGEPLVETLVKPEEKGEPKETKPKPNKTVVIELLHPFSENFLPHWDRWLKFKKDQFRFTYKTQESLQTALNDLVKISGEDEQSAIAHIDYAIAKGWKGLYPIEKNKNGTTLKPVTSGNKQAGANELAARVIGRIDTGRTGSD